MNAESLDSMEYGFASTTTNFATAQHNSQEIRDHIRESLRLHRFLVFTWLLEHGAVIPAELMADETHPMPGKPVL